MVDLNWQNYGLYEWKIILMILRASNIKMIVS